MKQYRVCRTNNLLWTGIRYPLCSTNKEEDATTQPFINDDEHGKAIDLIISMKKKGDGDIQKPEIRTNGNIPILIIYDTHTYPKQYTV
jgi:hypothetical protein